MPIGLWAAWNGCVPFAVTSAKTWPRGRRSGPTARIKLELVELEIWDRPQSASLS